MEYKITGSDPVKQELWNEQTVHRLAGGFRLKKGNLPESLEYLPKGTPLVLDYKDRDAFVFKVANFITRVDDHDVQVEKGHIFIIGDEVLEGGEILAIDTSNEDYDVITFSEDVSNAFDDNHIYMDVVDGRGPEALSYFDVKLSGQPQVTAVLCANEVKLEKLPYPLGKYGFISLVIDGKFHFTTEEDDTVGSYFFHARKDFNALTQRVLDLEYAVAALQQGGN
jgi:hypothetical protein